MEGSRQSQEQTWDIGSQQLMGAGNPKICLSYHIYCLKLPTHDRNYTHLWLQEHPRAAWAQLTVNDRKYVVVKLCLVKGGPETGNWSEHGQWPSSIFWMERGQFITRRPGLWDLRCLTHLTLWHLQQKHSSWWICSEISHKNGGTSR